MNFGDLIGLILFVLFFVLPAVTRLQRRGQPGAPPPGAPGRPAGQPGPAPGQPGRTPGMPTQAGTATSTAGTNAPPSAPFPPLEDDDLARRLADARERVRRAVEGRGAGPTAGPTAAPAPAPVARPAGANVGAGRSLVRGDLDDGLLRTPLPQQAPAPSRARPPRVQRPPIAARSTMAARDLTAKAPQVEVERLEDPFGRRQRTATVLKLDNESVRNGFIWHQVLGAPRARRQLGGGLSRNGDPEAP